MARKTNKTAHVLDLLTHGEGQSNEEQETAKETEVKSKTAPPASKKVTVVNNTGKGDEVANQILEKLSETLEKEEKVSLEEQQATGDVRQESAEMRQTSEEVRPTPGEEKPTPEGGRAMPEEVRLTPGEVKPMPEGIKPKPEEVKPMPEEVRPTSEGIKPMPEEAKLTPEEIASLLEKGRQEPEKGQQAAEAPVISADRANGDTEETAAFNWQTVNVMEKIMEQEDLDQYIRQYGVCDCSRCRADITALILTNMPPKYVVVEKDRVSPMISFYRSKSRIRLLTEISKACITVKNNPRHSSPDGTEEK